MVAEEYAHFDFEPIVAPGLGFQFAEEEFPGVHESGEDGIVGSGDVAEVVSCRGEDHDGEGIVGIGGLALEDEHASGQKQGIGAFDIPVAGAGDVAFQEHDFLGEGHEPALGSESTVDECKEGGINWD